MYESFYDYEYDKYSLTYDLPSKFSYVHFSNIGKNDSLSTPITLYAKTLGLNTSVSYPMFVNKDCTLESTTVEEKGYIPTVKLISEPIGPLHEILLKELEEKDI